MMKRSVFVFAALACMALASCSDNGAEIFTIGFERAELLKETGGLPYTFRNILWGKDDSVPAGEAYTFSGPIYSEMHATFQSYYDNYGGTYDTWGGWAISNNRDTVTEDYSNQFSVYAKSAGQFAVGYWSGYSLEGTDIPVIDFVPDVYPLSMQLACSTIGYQYSRTSSLPDYYYHVLVEGFLGVSRTGGIEVDLTDTDTWTTVDLTPLGMVDRIMLTPKTNDMGEWGMNAPAYVCVDNIRYSLLKP